MGALLTIMAIVVQTVETLDYPSWSAHDSVTELSPDFYLDSKVRSEEAGDSLIVSAEDEDDAWLWGTRIDLEERT